LDIIFFSFNFFILLPFVLLYPSYSFSHFMLPFLILFDFIFYFILILTSSFYFIILFYSFSFSFSTLIFISILFIRFVISLFFFLHGDFALSSSFVLIFSMRIHTSKNIFFDVDVFVLHVK
jgi:hypothetical protein